MFNRNKRCSLKQIAEAAVLSVMDHKWNHALIENKNTAHFKSLDNFIAIVYNFTLVFEKKLQSINEKFFGFKNSEEEFVNFLALRCETLSPKRDHFGLILAISFATEALRASRERYKCLHYDSPSCRYLLEFLKNRFKYLENKSNWNSLMHFCKELNRKFLNCRKGRKHVPMDKPKTSESSSEDLGCETGENSSKCKSAATETRIINKLECPDIDKEEMKNISEPFNEDTDKRCDQSIEITQSKVISEVSQNDEIEKVKTQEINKSYTGGNIAVNTTPFSGSEVLAYETGERSGRKRKGNEVETGIINKLKCLDIDTEEKKNIREHFSVDTDKRCDQSIEINQSKVIADVSQNDKIENEKTQEINEIYIGSNIASNTTSFSSSEVLAYETGKRSGRKRKRSEIETGIIKKLGCPIIDEEELTNPDEHFNVATDKISDERLTITPSKVMSDDSQNEKVEKNGEKEINNNDIEKNVSSSPLKKIGDCYDTISSEDSSDDHMDIIRRRYNLLMPDPQYKSEIFGLLKKCKAGFDNALPNRFNSEQFEKDISSSSTTEREESDKSFESNKSADGPSIDIRGKIRTPVDGHKSDSKSGRKKKKRTRYCKNCKGKNFNLNYREWRRAFKQRYNNWSIVSDYFYED